ncbi:MAG: response regulator, partial [Deltaproteobacteria bacterium]|nr:response regulator [Deltaproteobacteria bacterium]
MNALPRKILVVDDSAMMRRMIRRELEAGGYTVFEAEDGIAALARAVELLPDLITLDVGMPRLDGFTTSKKLAGDNYTRRFTHVPNNRIPIIFVTANDTLEGRQQGFEVGAVDFVAKPFVEGDVRKAIDQIFTPKSNLEGFCALVVDDNSVARTIAADLLRRAGLDVITCENGAEACAVFSDPDKTIDLLVTDLVMPVMDGRHLCRKVRGEFGRADLPVIFLTAVDDQPLLISLFDAGATDYLVKPFVKEELLARVGVHLAHRRLTRELRSAIEALHQANAEIRRMSTIDTLTRCYNRAYLNDSLEGEIRKARRYGRELSVIMCDIDHFKPINDTWGHQVGDDALHAVAAVIMGLVRERVDWVARYGGEEFIIVLPETGCEGATILAERLRAAVSATAIRAAGATISMTASFGVTGFNDMTDDGHVTFDNLIKRLDGLLYQAKQAGRDCVRAGTL